MKLGLIGRSISHSLSPQLYRNLLGPQVDYDLIDIPHESHLPTLESLARTYLGINITSPYKQFYVPGVEIENEEVQAIGAINTLSFSQGRVFATNTDLVAVEKILRAYKESMPLLHLTLLGSGVMARLTILVAKKYDIPLKQLDRAHGLKTDSDLRGFHHTGSHLVINACSRDFTFTGEIHPDSHFWDYNYNFKPHQNTLPLRVKTYVDGQEMLMLQAQAAVDFWQRTNPKLKC
jgi:shikimate dehydrogenase